jgi:hypothetical protein
MSLFQWLFGKKAAPPESPPEFLQAAPPDWLIEMKGHGLPQGGSFSIRTQVFAATRTASADILDFPREAGGEPVSKTVNLERLELDRLLVILGFSFPQDLAEVSAEVKDGLPVTVTVFRRDPSAAASARCNLAGWLDPRKTAPPVVEIGRILMELKRRGLGPG